MLKKSCFYLIIFCAVIIICDYGIDHTIARQIDNKSPYYLSFTSIGANSLESRLDCWATIKTTPSIADLEKILFELIDELSLPADKNNLITCASGNSYSINYEAKNDCVKGRFIFEADSTSGETNMIVSLVTSDRSVALDKYEKIFNRMLGTKWNYYYLYTAALDCIIDNQSKDELLKVVNQKLKTENIQIYRDNNVISAAGYSPILDKIVKSQESLDGNKYNVQIALKNNLAEKKTYIYMGSPLILGDY